MTFSFLGSADNGDGRLLWITIGCAPGKMWDSRLNRRNDTVMMMITRGHGMGEDHTGRGVGVTRHTPEGRLERKWRDMWW